MFDFYGTRYDEDAGVVEYLMASEDPLHDGENVFYGREVHESIHEFVNKVKSGARGLGPEKRIKLLLGPVGSGKSTSTGSSAAISRTTPADEGRMYTFRWTNLGDVIHDQDPADDVVQSPMNQDPLVLLPQEQRDVVIEQLNENLDAPYTIRNDQALDPASEFYMDRLLADYDDDLQAVVENHIESSASSLTRTSAANRDPRAHGQEELRRDRTHRRRQLLEARGVRRVRPAGVRLRRRVL